MGGDGAAGSAGEAGRNAVRDSSGVTGRDVGGGGEVAADKGEAGVFVGCEAGRAKGDVGWFGPGGRDRSHYPYTPNSAAERRMTYRTA